MLEGIPSRALNHVGHTSWCTFSVVSVGESCSYVMYLFQVVDNSVIVGVSANG